MVIRLTREQAVYYITKVPEFHQVAYALLTCTIVFRKMYIMEAILRPALRKRCPERADGIMRDMWLMALTGASHPLHSAVLWFTDRAKGVGLFLVGFGIWNLDNIYCHHLRSWRGYLLLPWAVVLEGHAWWHLFTGLGTSHPSPDPRTSIER